MIRTTETLLNEIVEYSRSLSPQEACGALWGTSANRGIRVTRWQAVANISGRPERQFLMEPTQWIAQWYSQNAQEQIVGIFHSHPGGPEIPSSDDLQTLWHALPSYWIVSLSDCTLPRIAAYRIMRQPGPGFATAQYERLSIHVDAQ